MVAAAALIALHVRSMSLTSDTPSPRLGVPFRVTISIGVKENVPTLPNVYLPAFFGPEELGDERSTVHGAQGTLYRETLTLEAHARGPLRIGAAKMDAIDARDGKPKRFISNDLVLNVEGGPLLDVWSPVRAFLGLVAYTLLPLAAIVAIVVLLFRRKARSPRVQPVQPPPSPPAPVPAPVDTLSQAIERLRDRRSRAAVLEVRSAIWRAAGASPGETLGDVEHRLRSAPQAQREAAARIERAAFIDDERLQSAIDEFLHAAPGGVRT